MHCEFHLTLVTSPNHLDTSVADPGFWDGRGGGGQVVVIRCHSRRETVFTKQMLKISLSEIGGVRPLWIHLCT